MTSFWALALPAAAFNLFWSGFNYHSVDVMSTIASLDATKTSRIIFLPLAIAIGIAAFVTGLAIDKISTEGKLGCLALVYMALAACMVVLLFVEKASTAVLFAILYGLCCGSMQSLQMPMYACKFGLAHLGKVQSLGSSLSIVSAGLGPILFAYVKEKMQIIPKEFH